jgi:hypothetical protein
MDAISPASVERFRDDLRASGYAPGTIKPHLVNRKRGLPARARVSCWRCAGRTYALSVSHYRSLLALGDQGSRELRQAAVVRFFN